MKFKFTAVVQFEISVEEATEILMETSPYESDGSRAVAHWLAAHTPCPGASETYCASELKKALGVALAVAKVDERRQLCLSTGTQCEATPSACECKIQEEESPAQ